MSGYCSSLRCCHAVCNFIWYNSMACLIGVDMEDVQPLCRKCMVELLRDDTLLHVSDSQREYDKRRKGK